MADPQRDLVARITRTTTAGYRGNLVARGLSRGLVWRDGIPPADGPNFSADLTADLLDHGFQLLSAALDLRDARGDQEVIRRGLYAAAESLESASRHDSQQVPERGFYLTMAAAAFHIGGYAARAYSLFEGQLAGFNLSSYETALVHLMRRNLSRLRDTFMAWLSSASNSDEGVLRRLQGDNLNEETAFRAEDVVAMALTRHFHRSIATFEHSLFTGAERYQARALEMFLAGEQGAAEVKHVPLWWSFRVARHLCDDLWDNSLRMLLPSDGGPELWVSLREHFIRMLMSRHPAEIDLWPSQRAAAARVVDSTDDLVVALPTSAGKTRIAELCILRTLADRRRVVYVTPLRALSAQIEHGLARTFRPLGFSVTSVYGASGVAHSDLETLQSATIVVATPEKLDFAVRQEPTVIDGVGLIVLDEGHMIGFSEREIRYEMLIQRLLRRGDADSRRLVCLSAVFAEGEAFDDFTAWLRSDLPGGAVRSTWRPTRQRAGRLLWTGATGKLELDVDEERPFVPRFVDSQPATGRRRVAFPNNEKEYIVAAASSFLRRGQTVLIYCPEKRSVEPTAAAFLTATGQGYFSNQLSATQKKAISDAKRIGEEWLGEAHLAVKCLDLGIAVHHGSLPRSFLTEIEHLLRRRVLPVCVCSPTLAQGLDLSFSVLLLKSIYRSGETVPPKEFANVIGRVGRAFVDLDGLYVLPVFARGGAASRKVRAFQNLIRESQQRELESGVKELVSAIIGVLTIRLQCNTDQLREYVLNVNSSWDLSHGAENDDQQSLDVALNELDTAILGIVDTLELPIADVADYLDECLQGSYWQRRVGEMGDTQRELQATVIRGRAKWLWKHSKAKQRRAYFASGVGHKAGAAIEQSLSSLRTSLSTAESALAEANTREAGEHTAQAAETLFQIGPFLPTSSVKDLPALLDHWLAGTPLSAYPDNEAVGFIQENVVYRLVWAVEATRLHLEHLEAIDESDGDPPGSVLALCLTYGVPSVKAALFMQGGVRKRSLAAMAAMLIPDPLIDFSQLRSWMRKLAKGEVHGPIFDDPDDVREWERFISRFGHRNQRRRRGTAFTLQAVWNGGKLPKQKAVRVRRVKDRDAIVLSVSSLPLGRTQLSEGIRGEYFVGKVGPDGKSVRIISYV